MKNFFKVVFSRAVFTGVFIALQFAAIFLAVTRFNEHFALFYGICLVLSAIVVIYLVGRDGNPAYKIAWIIPILALPVFGVLLYLVFGKNQLSPKEKARMSSVSEQYEKAMRSVTAAEPALPEHTDAKRVSDYIHRVAATPVFTHTETTYLPVGEAYLKALLAELEKAEKFIFMEYYIIAPGQMWDAIHDVLRRKAKDGVDVRVMYDGTCEFSTLPHDYPSRLEALGIRCKMFLPVIPLVSTHYNYRDHRKILVIDGRTAYTGGVNLADEYIGHIRKFGEWKDIAVRLDGEAARSFTLMFLQMWAINTDEPNLARFLQAPVCPPENARGFVLPYGDCPLDGDKVGERVYMDMLNRATRYVHITTPYLILDGEMETALRFAAERGVDVRLILPGVPDKIAPYSLAKTHYAALLDSGVKIFEFTPGFVHAKMFVCDDREAVVGTINLDYRSLYHHFECAAWMYDVGCIGEIEADYQRTEARCRQVTKETIWEGHRGLKWMGYALKTIAPLM